MCSFCATRYIKIYFLPHKKQNASPLQRPFLLTLLDGICVVQTRIIAKHTYYIHAVGKMKRSEVLQGGIYSNHSALKGQNNECVKPFSTNTQSIYQQSLKCDQRIIHAGGEVIPRAPRTDITLRITKCDLQ